MKQLLMAFVIFFTVFIVPVQAEEALKFGSVAMDIPAVMHKRLKPMTHYLSRELGRPVELILSPDMKDAIEAVAQGRVDIAYLTPVAYLRSHKKGQTQLVAKTVTNGTASFQLMIISSKDGGVNKVEDLKGKRFAFGDRAALLQRAVVKGAGVELESLSKYEFLGHYDNIVRGVLVGDFDAGILKDTMAYQWASKGIQIIHKSPALPPYNITASKKVSAVDLEKIKQAFLSLNSANPSHKEVIKALDKKYDGFAETSDQEYDVVRQLIKPFEN